MTLALHDACANKSGAQHAHTNAERFEFSASPSDIETTANLLAEDGLKPSLLSIPAIEAVFKM